MNICMYQYLKGSLFGNHFCSLFPMFMPRTPEMFVIGTFKFSYTCIYLLCRCTQKNGYHIKIFIIWQLHVFFGVTFMLITHEIFMIETFNFSFMYIYILCICTEMNLGFFLKYSLFSGHFYSHIYVNISWNICDKNLKIYIHVLCIWSQIILILCKVFIL